MRESMRDMAREAVRGPGKFQGEHPMVPILWGEIVLQGFADDDVSTDWGASAARTGRWVLVERPDGFVVGARYRTVAEAEQAMVPWHREGEEI